MILGPNDEPQEPGALVVVHYGLYRNQEVWVRSGANHGNWYPLGGEFWAVWDPQRRPPGVTKQDPEWSDVLARGPVTLLVAADGVSYRAGWRAGRYDLWRNVEQLLDD